MKILAHRGYSAKYPENTMKAFIEAYHRGFDGIETDVHMTSDGELVLIHDETIDRTSDSRGYILDYTLDSLKSIQFNNGFPEHETIPTLKELLTFIQDKDMLINLELKTDKIHYYGIEEKVVSLVKEMHVADKIIYSSFYLPSLLKIRDYDPNAYLGYLIEFDYPERKQEIIDHHLTAIHPQHIYLKSRKEVAQLKALDLKIAVWTVKSRKVYQRCLNQGIDIIIANEYFE